MLDNLGVTENDTSKEYEIKDDSLFNFSDISMTI